MSLPTGHKNDCEVIKNLLRRNKDCSLQRLNGNRQLFSIKRSERAFILGEKVQCIQWILKGDCQGWEMVHKALLHTYQDLSLNPSIQVTRPQSMSSGKPVTSAWPRWRQEDLWGPWMPAPLQAQWPHLKARWAWYSRAHNVFLRTLHTNVWAHMHTHIVHRAHTYRVNRHNLK